MWIAERAVKSAAAHGASELAAVNPCGPFLLHAKQDLDRPFGTHEL